MFQSSCVLELQAELEAKAEEVSEQHFYCLKVQILLIFVTV